MNVAATIERMEQAGMSPDAILVALKCFVSDEPKPTDAEVKVARKREADRLRMAERRVIYDAGPMDWETLRFVVLDKWNRQCAYCGVAVDEDFHVDHVNPICRGGDNSLENLALSCAPCNLSKGGRTVEEWLA